MEIPWTNLASSLKLLYSTLIDSLIFYHSNNGRQNGKIVVPPLLLFVKAKTDLTFIMLPYSSDLLSVQLLRYFLVPLSLPLHYHIATGINWCAEWDTVWHGIIADRHWTSSVDGQGTFSGENTRLCYSTIDRMVTSRRQTRWLKNRHLSPRIVPPFTLILC